MRWALSSGVNEDSRDRRSWWLYLFARLKPGVSAEQAAAELAALHAHCRQRYPDVLSTRLMLLQEQHLKHVSNSLGADAHSAIQRTALVLALLAKDERGTPIEVSLPLSCKGSAADLEFSVAALDERIDALHTHLQAKRHAVAPRGGEHLLDWHVAAHFCSCVELLGGEAHGAPPARARHHSAAMFSTFT